MVKMKMRELDLDADQAKEMPVTELYQFLK